MTVENINVEQAIARVNDLIAREKHFVSGTQGQS